MTAPLRFFAQACAVTVAAVLIGYLPTRQLAGPEALPAMVAGCLVGLVSSLVGAGPIFVLRTKGAAGSARLVGFLLSTVLRMFSAALLGAAAYWTGRFETRPLLLWIGLSYVVNLVVEARFAMNSFPRDAET